MAKILLVEDDALAAELLVDFLEHERYSVEHAGTATQAKALLKVYGYDLLVLDWELPDGTGIDILKTFRNAGGRTPVIMLTGKKATDDKETGLDSGADDYLTKPFDMRELSARLRALLRRNPVVQDNLLTCGYLSLDTAAAVASRDGENLKLLPTEYALLEFLMRNQGRVFSTDALLENVWKAESEATSNGVRTYITRLRAKIDKDNEPSLLKTVHGLGYKLEV
jgi:DNA-binding response OmpR family regulator